MRSLGDRARHAISFEILGLALVTPLGAWAFDMPLHDIGIVSIVSATIATAWNSPTTTCSIWSCSGPPARQKKAVSCVSITQFCSKSASLQC